MTRVSRGHLCRLARGATVGVRTVVTERLAAWFRRGGSTMDNEGTCLQMGFQQLEEVATEGLGHIS